MIISAQSDKSRDFVNVLILLAAALCVGAYLIVTTVIISKDGVTFIEYAQRLENVPFTTMANEAQHPGYPWLIVAAYKMTGFLHENTSISRWIYCSQSITLLFRLLNIPILYFIGKQLLGVGLSFWGILILVVLPYPAEYGSDALSDWPHLFFLATGLLLLVNGVANKKWWMFGFAGIAGGAGYLIRPECAQLVVLGGSWLGLQLFCRKRAMSKIKLLSAFLLLFIGFSAVAGPYMKLKGAIFPKKNVGQFAQGSQLNEVPAEGNQTAVKASHSWQFALSRIAKALGKFAENMGATLMWFFVPALLIGMYKWFRLRTWSEPEVFIITVFIVLNVSVMIWLYCKHGYMDIRHTLPLLVILVLYVPVGLQQSAFWIKGIFSKKMGPSVALVHNETFWFLVLFLIGISICAPKLFKPIRVEKEGYRAAAEWLRANTDDTDTVAVPDKRISFYAQREGFVYKNETGNIPADIVYTVRTFKSREGEAAFAGTLGKVEYTYVNNKRKKGINVIIYKKF